MQKQGKTKQLRKPQRQARPGYEARMKPKPVAETDQPGTGKLRDKIALITGGDSGIGRAVAILFAKEGAKVAIAYLNEHKDARETQRMVNRYNECILLPGDLGSQVHCKRVVKETIDSYGRIDVLVNNAGLQYESKDLTDITPKQLIKTFTSNVFSFFWITQEALPYIPKGGSIINTSSVTAYRGSAGLMDYSATKGAIVSFTRSLASSLIKKGIRVNGVAPEPIWTPLIVSSFKPAKVAKFGSDSPMQRAGEPIEAAFAYLFLASNESSYFTGQFLHPNGGEIING